MLNYKEKLAVETFKNKLQNIYKLENVILFGSKARGDSVADSDIDLLVLLNQFVGNTLEEEIFGIAFDVEFEYDLVLGVIVKNSVSWKEKEIYYPLGQNIGREGIAA